MELPYTAAAVGAILIIMQQALMMNTGIYRGKVRVGVGYGDDQELERKIRRHGNLAENAGVFIIVLALTEGIFGGNVVVTGFGIVFVVARLSHAIAFNSIAGSHGQENGPKMYPLMRMAGAVLSGLCGIGLGLYLLAQLLM